VEIKTGTNMAKSSFQDTLRRAIGVPTSDEREAAAAEAAIQREELENDQPRRQALVNQFNDSVAPVIAQTFEEAQQPVEEAGLKLDEVRTFSDADVLIQRSFLISPQKVRVLTGSYQIPTLNFWLLPSGNVTVHVPDPSSTHARTPLLPVDFKPRRFPLADMAARHVLAAFSDYIAACAAKIR
jgi:hypothetical protein